MKKALIIVTLLITFQVNAQNKQPLVIGEIVTLKSKILNEDRVLNIYLPLSYHKDSLKKYPVIYLLDGSIDEDFIHISGLVQFGSFSWINILPETIVVGISNVDRKRDFTFPTTIKKDKKDFPTTGKSANFIQFLEEELQPFIGENYQVNNQKTLIGQSLGGLLATEILFNKPELFDNYIIISPSLWWNNQSLLKQEPKPYTNTKNVFVGVGKEGKIMERDAENLYKKLVDIDNPNTKISFQFFKNQDHGDVLHLAVYKAFEKIFSTK